MRTAAFISAIILAACAYLTARNAPQGPVEVDPTAIVQQPGPAWPFQTTLHAPPSADGRTADGRITIRTAKKRMAIDWAFDTASGQRGFSTQQLVLAYWPTAAVALGDALLVAGVSEQNGHTIVERWDLDFPPLPGDASDRFEVRVTAVGTVHDSAAGENGHVEVMTGLYRQGMTLESALVLFSKSRSLCSLGLGSGLLTEVYGPASCPPLGKIATPYLGDFLFVMNHATRGYIYLFGYDTGGDPPSQSVAFFDADRSGSLDSWQVLGQSEWDELGPIETWAGSVSD